MAYDRWFLFATGSGSMGDGFHWNSVQEIENFQPKPCHGSRVCHDMSRVSHQNPVSCQVARCCKMLQDVARSQENALHSSNLWCSAAVAALAALAWGIKMFVRLFAPRLYKSKWSLEISRTECQIWGLKISIEFFLITRIHSVSSSFSRMAKAMKANTPPWSRRPCSCCVLLLIRSGDSRR